MKLKNRYKFNWSLRAWLPVYTWINKADFDNGQP